MKLDEVQTKNYHFTMGINLGYHGHESTYPILKVVVRCVGEFMISEAN